MSMSILEQNSRILDELRKREASSESQWPYLKAAHTELFSCKFTMLCNYDSAGDELRYNFLNDVCGDAELASLPQLVRSTAETYIDEFMDDFDVVARLCDDVEEAATQFGQVCIQVEQPENFDSMVWPCYREVLCVTSYFFSVAELLLICAAAKVNGVVFRSVGGNLVHEGSHWSQANPPLLVPVMLEVAEGFTRGHFSRLVAKAIVDELSEELRRQSRAIESEKLSQRRESMAMDTEDVLSRSYIQPARARIPRCDASYTPSLDASDQHAADQSSSYELFDWWKEMFGDDAGGCQFDWWGAFGDDGAAMDQDDPSSLQGIDIMAQQHLANSMEPPVDSGSDTDSQACFSDDEDLFDMRPSSPAAMPSSYRKSLLEVLMRATKEVMSLIRPEPLLPLDPFTGNAPCTDVDTPILWPSWHCPFQKCTACGLVRYMKASRKAKEPRCRILQPSNHIREAWSHIWGEGIAIGAHRIQLGSIVDREFPELMRKRDEREEMALTLLEEALAEKCRSTIELVGHARDRRCLNHIQEILQEENCKTLMCFICNSKHVYYHGLSKFGHEYNAGRIDYRNSDTDRAIIRQLLSDKTNFFAGNLCAKRFRTNYGSAVAGDEMLFQDDCWEWRRCLQGQRDCEMICNPEDVVRSVYCTHKDEGAICYKCHIPICNECWQFSMNKKDIPKALVNDNFIGYIRKYFLERSVTWLEATIACPLFSGLVTYYIEGERSDRHHLMQDD